MGSSVGIGALIMGVTLLSVFAIATTVINNQAEVALEVTNPDVIDKPILSLSNVGNSGSVGSLSIASPGFGYYPGNLVFAGDCNQLPSGEYTVSAEQWQTNNFPDDVAGSYDGHGFVRINEGEVSQRDIDGAVDASTAMKIPSEERILHVLPKDYIIDGQANY